MNAHNDAVGDDLARHLLFHRKKRGLTRRELARLASIHEDALQKVELGQRLPSLNTLVALANALDVPVSTLVGPFTEEEESGA